LTTSDRETALSSASATASKSSDLSVTGWTWKVSYSFLPLNKVALPQVPPHDILVPSGGTVDLNSAVKVPGSSGVGLDQVTVIRAAALKSAEDASASAASAGSYATSAAGSASASAGSAAAAAATSADFQAQANNPGSSWWATFMTYLRTIFVGKGELLASVKDYGAKGDGVTDDTAAIQAAVNAIKAKGRGTLFFPQGDYFTISAVPICGNLTIAGDRATLTKNASSTTGVVFVGLSDGGQG